MFWEEVSEYSLAEDRSADRLLRMCHAWAMYNKFFSPHAICPIGKIINAICHIGKTVHAICPIGKTIHAICRISKTENASVQFVKLPVPSVS